MISAVSRTDQFFRALCSHHNATLEQVRPLPSNSVSERHEFTVTADMISQRITEMRDYLKKCQYRYTNFSLRGMKDSERDDVDASVAKFLRTAMSQIDVLKQDAVKQLQERTGGSFPAHKLGVVVILNDDLQQVSSLSESLRGARINQAIAEKQRVQVKYDPEAARQFAEERKRSEFPPGEEDAGDDFQLLEQQFASENATLLNELVETREQVRQAEKTLFEIANLNHVFATKVLEQAKEIEVLYDLAVEATTYVERGNRELKKMKQRGPVLKYGLAGMALLLAFALIFLEWMGRRRSLFFL